MKCCLLIAFALLNTYIYAQSIRFETLRLPTYKLVSKHDTISLNTKTRILYIDNKQYQIVGDVDYSITKKYKAYLFKLASPDNTLVKAELEFYRKPKKKIGELSLTSATFSPTYKFTSFTKLDE